MHLCSLMDDRIKKALAMRRRKEDKFRNDNGYSWDYVMVFKVYRQDEEISDHQRHCSMKKVLAKLAKGGLETRLFYSCQHDEVYCKIRAPLERLMREADRINYKLLLNPVVLKQTCLHDDSVCVVVAKR